MNEFRKKFRLDDLVLYENDFWIWSLRPHQATLGAGILSLKRPCPSFSGLTVSEFDDLGNMIKIVEGTLTRVVEYNVINYMMLMMFDKQVHFHVIPRFESPRYLLDIEWTDDSWPAIPSLQGDPLAEDKLKLLRSLIQAGITNL